jgi:hypothetical protein
VFGPKENIDSSTARIKLDKCSRQPTPCGANGKTGGESAGTNTATATVHS